MFCGWQLANDFEELTKLNSGVLVIDIKTGKCTSNDMLNTKLTMPLVLNDWFLSDLKENSLNLNEIDVAELIVNFNMHDFGNRSNKGKLPIFECSSKLKSGGNAYTMEYKGEKANNEVVITYNKLLKQDKIMCIRLGDL